MFRRAALCGIFVFILVLFVLPLSFSITDPTPGTLADRISILSPAEDLIVAGDEAGADSGAFDRFRGEAGGQWWGRLVAGSGRASLVSGSGLSILPVGADQPASLDQLEGLILSLVAAHPDLLGPGDGTLAISPSRSAVLQKGTIAFVDFDLMIGAYPVRGARVFARLNHGNVIQLGTRLLGGSFDAQTPTLSLEQATESLFEYVGGRGETDTMFGEAELYFMPLRSSGRLEYRLVYEIAFHRGDEVETWTGRVSATDGRVLEFFDGNLYGEVTGGVYERTVVDPEVVRPFFDQRLDDGTVTDRAGHFLFDGTPVSTSLSGEYFRTSCEACTNPGQASVMQDLGLGWLQLGTGGTDAVGNGVSTKAERNAFYHLSMIRLQATKWLSIGWLNNNIQTNVNINDTCNAFYNGTVNFYRSGGGCNNTGEIADVMQHEWGHGLDNNTQGGDSATGEGTADHVAFLLQHDPVIGPYFRTSGSGVRNLDKETSARGLLTWTNVLEKCGTGTCSGPRGRECHCEGEIYGQTGWDLANALVAKHGYHTGWQELERIFYTSLPQAGSYGPGVSGSIYDAYLAVDDDDGNLANGTPNGQEIFDAFDLHEIAGDPVGSSTYCTRPTEPVVTITPGCDQLELSWDPVAGATEYHVMRQPLSDTKAFLPVATVTGTSYIDTEVAPGATYYYVVEAIDAGTCRSTIENVLTVTGPDKPHLGLVGVVTDDVPAGNRSGTVDPGEAVDLFLTLENASASPGMGVSGTLDTSTPGITLDVASQVFPDVSGLGMTVNQAGFRFSVDGSVECGSMIDFTFTVTDSTGCAVDTQYFSVRVGIDDVKSADTFETDLGWSFDAPGSSATTGDWTRGVPDATSYQPGNDSNDAGDLCWFTAPNPGGDGSDDIDGGEVVLVSPVFDLSSMTEPAVSYQRWFGNRDTGEDDQDYYWVEVSDNGGSSWVTVEKLDTNISAPSWTRVSFDLASLITLNDQVRFRVRVSDGPEQTSGDGKNNLVEGGFDDFRITEPLCDDTPPCFVEPTFSGLDSSGPGPDCAEASMSWSAASSNCLNAEIHYNLYRSTDAEFQPSPASLIAEDLDIFSYQDSLLDPETTYYYLVRAFDSRSGEDSNLERGAVIAPSTPDTKAPIFTGLISAASGEGCGEAALTWSAALETCSTPVVYHVYRSTTPGFSPSQETLLAQTTELSLIDAGLDPKVDYHYVVQAVDQAQLADGNALEQTATATMLAEIISEETFEAGAAGWTLAGTNDATTGLWELGDPVKTDAQPGDCPSGTNCWVTGLSGPGVGDNDIDGGTTTLLSAQFSATGMQTPAIRYTRYYSNNAGATPGTDTWLVDISTDDGANWESVESTQESDANLAFREVEYVLPVSLTPTDQMRVRFIASDLGEGSVVEAEVDDFQIVDIDGGCDDCAAAAEIGTILLTRDGEDVVLGWTADPVEAGRYKVYTLAGADFSAATLLGTTATKSYRHTGGALYQTLTSYRVRAVNSCGDEGP